MIKTQKVQRRFGNVLNLRTIRLVTFDMRRVMSRLMQDSASQEQADAFHRPGQALPIVIDEMAMRDPRLFNSDDTHTHINKRMTSLLLSQVGAAATFAKLH